MDLSAQAVLPWDASQVKAYAWGTGRTTGHVASLVLLNTSPEAFRGEVGPFLIPGGQRYQGYVINKSRRVVIPPFGRVIVELQGYCTHVQEAAVPEGAFLPDPAEWISPLASSPAPLPGVNMLAVAGYRLAPPGPADKVDSVSLSFPATKVPFPYQITIDEHPASVANLLIHVANQLEKAYLKRLRRGFFGPADFAPDRFTQEAVIVQQAFWYYTSLLQATGYSREAFTLQMIEQIEQSVDHPYRKFSKKTVKDILAHADEIWAHISHICRGAGVILLPGETENPVRGRAPSPYEVKLTNIAPDQEGALDRWIEAKRLLRAYPELAAPASPEEVDGKLNELLATVILREMDQPAPNGFPPAGRITAVFRLLESDLVAGLNERARRDLEAPVREKWQALLAQRTEELIAARADAPFEEVSDLLSLLKTEELAGRLPEKFVRKQEKQLRKGFQNKILSEVQGLDQSAPEVGGRIMALKKILTFDSMFNDSEAGKKETVSIELNGMWSRWVTKQLENLAPADRESVDKILNFQLLMSSDQVEHDVLRLQPVNSIKVNLDGLLAKQLQAAVNGIEPQEERALPELLFQLSRLDILQNHLPANVLDRIREELKLKLNQHLQNRVARTASGSQPFLLHWRTNDLIRGHWWCEEYGSEETLARMDSLQSVELSRWEAKQNGWVTSRDVDFDRIELSGEQWKTIYHTEYPVFGDGIRVSPWWLAVPVAGVATYLLLQGNDGGPPPPPPVANNDLFIIQCADTLLVNVLANDEGERLVLHGFGQAPGATVTQTDAGNLLIVVAGSGVFSFSYSVQDAFGQTAEAVVEVQVTAPALIAQDDDFSVYAPNSVSGNLLTNDTGWNPMVIATTAVNAGTVSAGPDGAFTFTPGPTDCGPASFQYVIEDGCAQKDTATVSITVEDDILPTLACPPDQNISCGADASPDATGQASGSDNCDPAPELTFSDQVTPGECDGEQNILRTWRITDAQGNVSECMQRIALIDDTPPSLTCVPVVNVTCAQGTDPVVTGQPIVSDNCSPGAIPALTYTDDAGGLIGCGGSGVLIRIWTAVDACGNASQCMQQIMVEDNSGPVLELPPAVSLGCGESTDPTVTGVATASDDCTPAPDLIVTYEDSPDGNAECGGSGSFIRTWTATDLCGNTTTGTQLISLADTSPPDLSCPPGTFVSCEQSTSPQFTGQPVVADNCDTDPTLGYFDNLVAGDCINERFLARSWQAVDACGNSNTCVQLITIGDITPPLLEIPPDIAIECSQNAGPQSTGFATATDACSGPAFIDISYSDETDPGGCAGELTITRTWTATDPCGNVSSASQTITRLAADPPMILCPPNITIGCSANPNPSVTGYPGLTVDCGSVDDLVVGYVDALILGAAGSYAIQRTWTLTDPCDYSAECAQLIQVQNATEPVAVCPPGVTIDCSETADPTLTGEPELIADCALPDDLNWVYSDQNDDVGGCGGNLIRTWTLLDVDGQTYTCNQLITLEDTTAPTLQCPADLTVEVGDGTAPAVTGQPGANDDCSPPAELDISYTDNDTGLTGCGGTGDLLRTWTAVDACGNSDACEQVITLQDTTQPTIVCPPDLQVEVDQGAPPAVTGEATAMDNAAGPADLAVSYADDASGLTACGNTGDLLRTWTATDLCGNTSACLQTITLTDSTPPVLTCPADYITGCGQDTTPATAGQASATDNNSGPDQIAIQYEDNLDGLTACNGTGTILRTWTATDACGNTISCVQQIQLTDNVPPLVTCPSSANILCGQQTDLNLTGQATATDNCGAPVDLTFNDDLSNLSNCQGAIIRTWTAVDPCGNSAQCQQNIFVSENTCDFSPTFDVNAAGCNQADGSITLTIDPPGNYDIEWETGADGNQLADIPAGTYAVTITDLAVACTEVFQVVVEESTTDYLDLVSIEANTCTAPGEIVLDLSGADFFFVEITGPNSTTISNQPAGTLSVGDFLDVLPGAYSIKVTDNDTGCTDTIDVNVASDAPYELVLVSFTNPSAPGAADGSIMVQVLGFPSYFLEIYVNGVYADITTPLPQFTIDNLAAGVYVITAIDLNNDNCPSNQLVVTLTDPQDFWGLELSPVADQRYFPGTVAGEELADRLLQFYGVEGLVPGREVARQYRLDAFANAWLVFHPNRLVDFRAGVSRFGGWATTRLRNPVGSGGQPLDIQSEFQGYSLDLGARFHPATDHWVPFLGIGGMAARWQANFLPEQGITPAAGLPGIQRFRDWGGYLSAGLRFRAGPAFRAELELLVRENDNLRYFDFLPGLSGRWRW